MTLTRIFPETIEHIDALKLMVLLCGHCHRAFVAELEWVSAATPSASVERFYPPPRFEAEISQFIPDGTGIAEALQEAALCSSVGAVMGGCLTARRAIQLIARSNGTKGKNLAGEIDSLKISEDLKTIAHSVRLIGNETAHPDPDDWNNVDNGDLEALLHLALELVRQLYEVPGRVERLRQRTIEVSGQDPAP